MTANVASPPAEVATHLGAEATTPIASKDEFTAKNSDRIPTPPTSEDMNKHEEHSSDLSDIDDLLEDDNDLDDIKPDHYWDEENGGKIPVFKPTMKQFRDFKAFVAAIDNYGMQSGIVKVIAPQEWRDSLGSLDEAVKSIRVKNPITQEFAGTHGTYTQANIEKQRSYNLPQWKNLCEESNHKTPARKGDRRKEAADAKAARATRPASTLAADGVKRKPGRPSRRSVIKEEDVPAESVESEPTQVPPTPRSPNQGENEDDGEDVKEEPNTKKRGRPGRKPGRKPGPKPGGGRQPRSAADVKKSVATRRLHNTNDNWEVDEEAFEDFDYHLENVDQFDAERCRELEETYWRTINFGTPMYGADMPGSLFNDSVTSWNVAHLPNVLDVLGTKVPGVNTAYLYLGMWKATFAWHLEDVDLYSINYIHFGAPKQWYSISQADARKFETAMRNIWPQDYKHCDQFMRHKTYLISPEKLKSQFGIKVNKLVHYEGEFVITYPYGYHSGFNLGYNCAESVNFATEDWLNYGRIAKKCLCEADSVWVDVNEIERKLRGEPTPEYYEVTDDEDDEDDEVLPTPPPSVKGRGTKRKRGPNKKDPKNAPEKKKVKKIKIRHRQPTKEPCILCPNDPTWAELLPCDNGKQAHRLCGLYTPETYIREDTATGKEMIHNVSHIDKARLEMKCNYCRSKKGSVFQCASKKCTRAFHATCAAAAGVLVDEGPVPTWDEAGVEYWYVGFDFRCKFHRPRRQKFKPDEFYRPCEALESNNLFVKYGKSLKKGDVAQAMYLDSLDPFAGEVVENRPSEGTVVIRLDPDMSTILEVEYKYLLVLDPAMSLRPKPTPAAIPLPENLHHTTDHSAENRKDGVPSKGDPFLDPEKEQVWEEFNCVYSDEVNNPHQKRVDFNGNEVALWHFLGRNSTEAKPQFTHDPKVKTNNPKSNFLDSVREVSAPRYNPLTTSGPSRTGYNSYGGYIAPRTGPAPLQPRPATGTNTSGTFEAKPYVYKPKESVAANVYNGRLPYQNWQVNTPTTHAHQAAKNAAGYQMKYAAMAANLNPIASTPASAYPGTRPLVPTGASPSPIVKPYTPVMARPGQGKSVSPVTPSSASGGNGGGIYGHAEKKYANQGSYGHLTTSTSTSTTPPHAPPPQHRPSTSSTTNSNKAVAKPSNLEYLEHIQKYPYLRNAYARRPEKYQSPYANGFGFGAEYEVKLQRGVAARGYAEMARREMEVRAAQQAQVQQAMQGGVGGAPIGEGGMQMPKPIMGMPMISTPYGTTAYGPPMGSAAAGVKSTTPPLPPTASPAPVAAMRAGLRGGSPERPGYSPLSGAATPVGLGIEGLQDGQGK